MKKDKLIATKFTFVAINLSFFLFSLRKGRIKIERKIENNKTG